MNYRCAHCGSELRVHRNMVIHPDESGCLKPLLQGEAKQETRVEDYGLSLTLANEAIRHMTQFTPEVRVYKALSYWDMRSWEALVFASSDRTLRGSRVTETLVNQALELVALRTGQQHTPKVF